MNAESQHVVEFELNPVKEEYRRQRKREFLPTDDQSDVVAIDDSHFIVLQQGLLYHIYANGNKFIWNSIQEKYYKGKIINDNLKIFKNKDNYLLNLDDGFIALQSKNENVLKTDIKIEAYNNENLVQNKSKISYNSELRMNIISGIFGATKPNLFYKINDETHYISVKEGQIVLNNLSNGSHDVVIFNHDGLLYTKISNFEFSPWLKNG